MLFGSTRECTQVVLEFKDPGEVEGAESLWTFRVALVWS
jgi:hypothetical protein